MQQISQGGLFLRRAGSTLRCTKAAALAGLALVAAGLGCSPDSGTVVVITAAGVAPEVQSIRATATLSAQTDVEVYTTGLGQFGMRLPVGASGVLGLTLDALRSDQCSIASGTGSVMVSGQSRADVSIPLLPLASPVCSGSPDLGAPTFPLTVTKSAGSSGTANGLLTSTPAGISCGATCTAAFAPGSAVALGVAADYGSLFLGWSGGCTASGGSCLATVNGATQAAAAFTTTTCSTDRLCLKLPTPLPATSFHGVWGTSAKDIWVVGAQGSIMHWDGAVFSAVSSNTAADLYSIWGASATDFWIGGAAGLVLRWNGSSFTRATTGGTQNVTAIWGSSATDVYFVDGSTSLQHWTGTAFSPFNTGTGVPLSGVWGSSATNFWMIGTGGQILRWNGASILVGNSSTTNLLTGIWGTAANDIWAVTGTNMAGKSSVIHYDGTSWTTISNTINDLLFAVSVVPGDVWAVGTNGAAWHYNGTTFVRAAVANASNLNGAWGIGQNDMWAVGDSGTIVHHEP